MEPTHLEPGGPTRSAEEPGAGRLARWVPALGWLSGYEAKWLRADVVAGVTLAAYLLPSAIGDASLAGLPLEAGLYACLFSGLVFWLFCSSRHTAITVTSAISLLMGSSLATLAAGDAARFGALAACTALLVASLAFVAWLARAGVIVNFISETVLDGWKTGVAIYLASTQLPKLLGLPGSHGNFWELSRHVIVHVGEVNGASVTLGLSALAVLVLGRVFLPNRPVALFVVLGGMTAAALLHLEARGVKLLGAVPAGLPTPGLPAIEAGDLNALLPLALACFLLSAVETAAVGRTFAARHGGRLDPDQEFLALAAANLAAGLGRGFPVSGGMSQSLVNESGGARTPFSGFVAATVVLLVTLFLSGSLRVLPYPVLAAVVLAAVAGLFKFSALKALWRRNRGEFVIAIAALLGVLGSGLLNGVLIGVILSLVLLLRQTSQPHVAFLGRIPATRRFTDVARHPDNERIPGVLIFRVESSLLYFNVEHVRDTVRKELRTATEPVRRVVCDLSNSPHVDLAGVEMLLALHRDLAAAGIALRLVEAHAQVRDLLRVEGFEALVGPLDRSKTVADAVDDAQNMLPDPVDRSR